MTRYVETDLTVDTVTLQWTYYRTDFNITGWKYNPPKKKGKPDSYYKKVNDVVLVYLPHWNMLMTSFSASKIVNNVLQGAKGKNSICVLMHDAAAKTTTVDALQGIIKGLKEQGFTFKHLTKESYGYHHSVQN